MVNAGIGMVQELGSITKKIPARSFLRMPIQSREKQITQDVAKAQSIIEKKIVEGDSDIMLEVLGIASEGQVQEAFETGGFGQWAPNSPITIHGTPVIKSGKNKGKKFIPGKGSDRPLIDTGEFRQSVISVVKRK